MEIIKIFKILQIIQYVVSMKSSMIQLLIYIWLA